MGYTLEFFSLARLALRERLRLPVGDDGAGRAAWLAATVGCFPAAVDLDALYREACAELANALDGGPLTADGVSLVSDPARMVFAVTVRSAGRLLGSLSHSSMAGERFRGAFLQDWAARHYGVRDLARWLTERPFYGVSARGYTSWGWLSAAEVRALAAHAAPYAGPPDEDMQSWGDDLARLLTAVAATQTDLVTLYG